MCIKKRLGKYRNSDQQFNTCSAVSCIYWTSDVIISLAVFFHNACGCTCPDSTLEYGKNIRPALLTLSFMKRRKKKSCLDRWVTWFMVGKVSAKPEPGTTSLHPLSQTPFTQPCEVGPKNLNQFLISHQWDLWSSGPQHTQHAHTRVCVTETRAPQHTGWEGRTQLQGCG